MNKTHHNTWNIPLHYNGNNEKQHRTSPNVVNDDSCSEDPTSIKHLDNLSIKDVREKMSRMFKELNNQEHIKKEMRKLSTEMTD